MIYKDDTGAEVDPKELDDFCGTHGVAIEVTPAEEDPLRYPPFGGSLAIVPNKWTVKLYETDMWGGRVGFPLIEADTGTPMKAIEVLRGLVLMVNPEGGCLWPGQRDRIAAYEPVFPNAVYEATASATK